jgi:hypothetical protein
MRRGLEDCGGRAGIGWSSGGGPLKGRGAQRRCSVGRLAMAAACRLSSGRERKMYFLCFVLLMWEMIFVFGN